MGAVSVADAFLKSNMYCVPVTEDGLIKHSAAQFVVPNPKSVVVGYVKLSAVPSNSNDAVPNFFCAVSNFASPPTTPVFATGTPVTNSPVPLPLIRRYVPSLVVTVPYAVAFL